MTAPQNSPVDPFAPVPVTGGGGLPGARHLEGRVVIIQPIRVDETTLAFNKKDSAPTVIADIIVVDGGDLVYGDQVNNSGQQLKPPTHRVSTPAVFRGWMDSHAYIVNPCRDMLRAGQPVTVGIIERGTQGNKPYFLTETHTDVDRKPRPAGHEQRRKLAIDVYNALQTGQWTPPTPVELNPTQQPAAQPSWAPQTVQQQAAAVNQGWGAQPQPAAQGWNTAASAEPQPSAFAQQAAAQGWGSAPSSAPQTASPDLSRPVPGFESMWQGMSEQQRAALWAAQPAGQEAPQATPFG